MKKRRFPASQMAIDAMLAAMCTAIAALITLKLGGNLEITFESVPVHIAALLFGPVDGMIVAGIGNFIYQLLFSGYGLTATTALWILPYIVCGFIVGAYARRRDYRLTRAQLVFIIVVSELCVTLLNTFALFVDSKLFGYYSAAFVFGTLALRLVICVAKAVCYGLLLPALLQPLRKALHLA